MPGKRRTGGRCAGYDHRNVLQKGAQASPVHNRRDPDTVKAFAFRQRRVVETNQGVNHMTRMSYILAGALAGFAFQMTTKSGTVIMLFLAVLAAVWAVLLEGVRR